MTESLDIHTLPARILEAKRNLLEAKLQLRTAREKVDEIRRHHGAQAITEAEGAYPDRKARSLMVENRVQTDPEYLAARATEDERERAKAEAQARVTFLNQSFEVLFAQHKTANRTE